MYLIVKRKALIVTMSAVLIFAVVLFVGTDVFVEHKAVNANADVNWGLSFNTDNLPLTQVTKTGIHQIFLKL